jgi:hypothetical protein
LLSLKKKEKPARWLAVYKLANANPQRLFKEINTGFENRNCIVVFSSNLSWLS